MGQDKQKRNTIERVGFLTEEKHLSEQIINPGGASFTIMAGTHGYGMGYIIEEYGKLDSDKHRQ